MTIKHLAFLSILLTFFLIVFGGYVASSESGLGCGPEWPMCNGELVPVLKGATLIEYLHRVIGALLGLITVLLFIKINRAKAGHTARFVNFTMLGLLTIQVLLGAVVVVRDLPSIIITIHLLIAMVFMACQIWIWKSPELVGTSTPPLLYKKNHRWMIYNLNLLLVLLLLTLAFGAYIKHQSYGVACGWLVCRNALFPTSIPELLQTIHRGLAVFSAGYILLLTYWAFSKNWGTILKRLLALGTFTVFLQLIIGVVVVVTTIDLPWAVLHLAVATALFAFISNARVSAGNAMSVTEPPLHSKEKWQNGWSSRSSHD